MQDPTGWLEEWNSELGKEAEGCYLDLRWAGSSDFQQHLKFVGKCVEIYAIWGLTRLTVW